MNESSPVLLFHKMQCYSFFNLTECLSEVGIISGNPQKHPQSLSELILLNNQLKNKLYIYPLYGLESGDDLPELRKILMFGTNTDFHHVRKMNLYELCFSLLNAELPENQLYSIFDLKQDNIFTPAGLVLKNKFDDFFYIPFQ